MTRGDGRGPAEVRPVRFERQVVTTAPGSCLVSFGKTKVLCTASIEPGVPAWLQGRGQGWLTAEYGMLPGSTDRRKAREGRRSAGVDGRTAEIQRLIGRSFRAVVDLAKLRDFTLYLDCDVLQADGGTRVASINGAWVALRDAVAKLRASGQLATDPVRGPLTAVSVGLVDDRVLVDLDQSEDQRAQVDMNIVMAEEGRFVEVQATAEGRSFGAHELQEALSLASDAIRSIRDGQARALGGTL